MAVQTRSTETESRLSGAASGMDPILRPRGARLRGRRLPRGGSQRRLERVAVALGELVDSAVQGGVLAAGEPGVLDAQRVSLCLDLHPHSPTRNEQRGEQPDGCE